MKEQNYFVGFDMGTNSVGYAVTNENYELCKFKGEPMWGVTLFDEANSAKERRAARSARRRLDRRQQRVRLVQELFAEEIGKIDEGFFRRIKESYLYPEEEKDKVRIFDTYEKQREYAHKFPTVHHLIVELMEHTEPHDVRLVYLACAWLVAHRGHFLSEVDKDNLSAVTDFKSIFDAFEKFICRDEYALPWKESVNLSEVEAALKSKDGITKKTKRLTEALFGVGKSAPKKKTEDYECNYALLMKLLCGGTVALKDLFDKEEYAELEEKNVALNIDDEKWEKVFQTVEEDEATLLRLAKQIYDWSVLVDVLKSEQTISKAKVKTYETHKRDLKELKFFIRKYASKKYFEVFRSQEKESNYVSYVKKNKAKKSFGNSPKADFCKYVLSIVKSLQVDEVDKARYADMIVRLETNDFMPKQVDGDNRVIPYQLYRYELKTILGNAKNYLAFLEKADEDGITCAEKILSVFEFRVPYYVGPLKESRNKKYNHWMVRKEPGVIYPWNFQNKVDLDASEREFIARMTNACTYLPGEDVLPKNSLVYCSYEVLNEINNISVNGKKISVAAKQGIYNELFMRRAKVTKKAIRDYLIANNCMDKNDVMSGVDDTIKSSLKPYHCFKRLIESKTLTYADAEEIIKRATYSEDTSRFSRWVKEKYPSLTEADIKHIASQKFKEFGRLSRALLCDINEIDPETGECVSIIRKMWETNYNLMQLLSDRFLFKKSIDEKVAEYYGNEKRSLSDMFDEMSVPNDVKRSIIRALDILKDVVKVQKRAPKKIFIEMARGTKEDQKGVRKTSRLVQIKELYEKVANEEVRELEKELEKLGDSADNKLQSDKVFLYFIQFGKCLYTKNPIPPESVLSGDGNYNIEHIYPRSFVKDDSIINNKILVESKANKDKDDKYPIDAAVQEKMMGYWKYLNDIGALSNEKYRRLTRKTPFTNEEKFEFINRQLGATRQSTKAFADILKMIYPQTEIVYVKAGLVSDFRQQFKVFKSRTVNDLHHAKDAYLNVVTGNVWHSKFSREFWKEEETHNAKPEVVFTNRVECYGKIVWNGASDKDRVLKIVNKNTAHITTYSYCRHSGQSGGFFDQNPVRASKGLIPIKKDRPTEIYGGYNKSTATFFVLVKYLVQEKSDVIIMPIELLYAERFLKDDAFALEYAKQTVSNILNKSVTDVEFLLGKRILKINTTFSFDGFEACLTGKSGGGRQLSFECATVFKASSEIELYVKRLSSFAEKKKENENIVYDEKHDGITKEKNVALYDIYIQKWQRAPYKYRPAHPCKLLIEGREKFQQLAADEQVTVLLAIHGLFGRAKSADLRLIGGSSSTGVLMLSSTISNWKKNYTDVRIVDRSASGLFETRSVNLLERL